MQVEPVLDIKKWQIRAYSSDYSIMEIDLLKNTSLTTYFNITSSDLSYLKSVNKIIDGRIYTLNTNLRNSVMVTKYCNNKFGYNIKESNYMGNSVKEFKFNSYKEILDLVKSYDDVVVIGDKDNLDYFRSNGEAVRHRLCCAYRCFRTSYSFDTRAC